MALTHLEIAIAAILTGYVIGWSVRNGALGMMRRRYQRLALVLTYFSFGLSFTPMVLKAVRDDRAEKAAAQATAKAADSTISGPYRIGSQIPKSA